MVVAKNVQVRKVVRQRYKRGGRVMEMLTRAILALYLAHLLTDQSLTSGDGEAEKEWGGVTGYAKQPESGGGSPAEYW